MVCLFPEFGGIVTTSVTVPLEHGIVVGNPVATRREEKLQVMAFVTCADKVTDPPEALSPDGVTENDDTVGFTGRIVAADADWGSEQRESAPTNAMTAQAPKTR